MPQVPDGLRARRLRLERAGETGFTLIELVLVLLIIGTLVAIVLPRFPSQTKSDAMTASKTASPANLLYPNGNQAPLGVCGRAGPTTIRPMAATSPLVKATNSTMAKTVATNPQSYRSRSKPETGNTVSRSPRTRAIAHRTIFRYIVKSALARWTSSSG
jgi:prepilin-type N-terminal cleavage/methylation domain-containing protein